MKGQRPGLPTPQGGHRNEATESMFLHSCYGVRVGRVGVQLLVIDLREHIRIDFPEHLVIGGARELREQQRRDPGQGTDRNDAD